MSWAVALLLLCIGAWWLGRRSSAPIVLGQQLAAARIAEDARLAAGPAGPSPMPSREYDLERGEHDLVRIAPAPLDDELRAFAHTFSSWSSQERADARARISMEEQYTLLHFAHRCAALGLHERSSERCVDGVLALSVIDETRIDPRDAVSAAGVLGCVIAAIGGDRPQPLARAAALATPGMAKILERAKKRSRLSDWGLAEIRTAHGVGLVQAGFGKYAPSRDLGLLSLRIADLVSEGKYTGHIEVGSEPPPDVWFAREKREAAKRKLEAARGAASIRGVPRKEYAEAGSMQLLLIWLVELPDDQMAAALVTDAQGRSTDDGRFCAGVASGPLFVLVVGGSWAMGMEPLESSQSIAALAEATLPLLNDATP